MYEWYNIVHNPDYEKRIFPIFLDDLRDRLNSEKRTEKLDKRMEILVDNVTTKEALHPKDLSNLDKFILKLGDDAFKNELHLLTTYYHNNSVPKLERFDYDVLLEQIKARINELTQTNYTSDSRNPVSAAAAPSLPKMTIREGIVPREKEVQDLKNLLDENRLVNMIGLGGCGKSTISEYFCDKYNQDYHIVTSVVVSIDYYEDFVNRFREAVDVPYKFDNDFKKDVAKTPNYKKTYNAIIEQLESDKYKGGDGKPNLIVIDVNETVDYEPVRQELAKFRSRLSSWKIFVVSRVKMCPDVTWYEPLNVTNVDDKILKDIFFQYLDRRRHDYYRKELNNHFSQLFTFLFRLPLLIEQLAYYLSNDIFDKTYQEILSDLKIDQDVFNKRFAGRNVKITEKDTYKVIDEYLGTLIIFSKLDELTQTGSLLRDIARHFAVFPYAFLDFDFIKQFVSISDDRAFTMGEGLRFLVDKCILTAQKDKRSFQMHSLVAKSCLRQIFTLEENKGFRNFDGFKQYVDSFDKTYNYKKKRDKNYRAAIAKSFTNIIPNMEEEENYVLSKAREYQNQDIYEHILKVKLLRLKKEKENLYGQLNAEDFVKKSVDQLYYSWLRKQPDKVLVPMCTDKDGNVIVSIKGVEIKMIKVDGGTFKMGVQGINPEGDNYDEEETEEVDPVHSVSLDSFYIGETQVTQGLWEAVMGKGNNPSFFKKGDYYPVEDVTWYDCLNFIIELNKMTGLKFRFPTEAQWEFAARGGTKKTGEYKYSGSDKLSEIAWYGWADDDKNKTINTETTMPVRLLKANDLGIYDMSGNVDEWCQDYFASYTSKEEKNPSGPLSLEAPYRVVRGGSWFGADIFCKVSSRHGVGPTSYGGYEYGMRLALPCVPFPS